MDTQAVVESWVEVSDDGVYDHHDQQHHEDGPPVGAARTVTVTLPDATAWDDAEHSDGTPGRVPSWALPVGAPIDGVGAWIEGVDVDGDLVEDVDRLEAGALAVLAAVTAHRQMARGDTGGGA